MISITNPFWRVEPFSHSERDLLDALFLAHHKSSFRDNPSSMTAINAAHGSGQLEKAIAAAILTIGGRHGPLQATASFLSLNRPETAVSTYLSIGEKVPGWGGAFQKTAPDPIWTEVNDLLPPWSNIWAKLDAVTSELHRQGKKIYPNPSAYTAATAIVIGLPIELTPYLFIAARLSPWTQIASKVL